MKNEVLFLCLFLLFPKVSFSDEITTEKSWEGVKSSLTYLYQGSYLQFSAKNNLYVATAALPTLWYSFAEDKRLTNLSGTKSIPKYMQITSDLAPVLSFPIIPIAFFSYGIKTNNNHAVQFAKESFATIYLALLESAVLSKVDVHERPNSKNLSKWETNFRGKSSFPSGHVIPFAALAIKTFQFYGPYYSILPAALYGITSVQRVRSKKHYVSDVVGGFFLTAFAAEGVRKAANYDGNHIVFKSLSNHNFQIGYINHQDAFGPKLSFDW